MRDAPVACTMHCTVALVSGLTAWRTRAPHIDGRSPLITSRMHPSYPLGSPPSLLATILRITIPRQPPHLRVSAVIRAASHHPKSRGK